MSTTCVTVVRETTSTEVKGDPVIVTVIRNC